MSTLQVRNLPEDVSDTLKRRAALAGQSLSAYVSGELSRLARQPTVEEFSASIARDGSVDPATSALEILRLERRQRS